MGKRSGIILGLITITISAGVGGYVLYDNFIVIPPTLSDENQWYEDYNGNSYIPSSGTWGFLSEVTIDFSVSSGQTVHILFVGSVRFDDSSIPNNWIEVKLQLDGVTLDYPKIYVDRFFKTDPEGKTISVSLQHYNNTITPGNHTIELIYRGNSIYDSVRRYSLFVQTFN